MDPTADGLGTGGAGGRGISGRGLTGTLGIDSPARFACRVARWVRKRFQAFTIGFGRFGNNGRISNPLPLIGRIAASRIATRGRISGRHRRKENSATGEKRRKPLFGQWQGDINRQNKQFAQDRMAHIRINPLC